MTALAPAARAALRLVRGAIPGRRQRARSRMSSERT